MLKTKINISFRPENGYHPAGRYTQIVWADSYQLGLFAILLVIVIEEKVNC